MNWFCAIQVEIKNTDEYEIHAPKSDVCFDEFLINDLIHAFNFYHSVCS